MVEFPKENPYRAALGVRLVDRSLNLIGCHIRVAPVQSIAQAIYARVQVLQLPWPLSCPRLHGLQPLGVVGLHLVSALSS
jgi:hypothetical protein